VHRIGRTGRADFSGQAISFCDVEERAYLKDIQKLIGERIPVVEEHPFMDDGTEAAEAIVKASNTNTHSRKPENKTKGNNNFKRKKRRWPAQKSNAGSRAS
jgi:ATP-dependent RNA helicase RhlE